MPSCSRCKPGRIWTRPRHPGCGSRGYDPGEMGSAAHLPRLIGTRYVVPLREGGSVPAVVDTDDGTVVVKFRGAGQGPKALIAEALFASVAQVLELPIPRAAIVDLAEGFGRSEPDPEIQDILRGSVG